MLMGEEKKQRKPGVTFWGGPFDGHEAPQRFVSDLYMAYRLDSGAMALLGARTAADIMLYIGTKGLPSAFYAPHVRKSSEAGHLVYTALWPVELEELLAWARGKSDTWSRVY